MYFAGWVPPSEEENQVKQEQVDAVFALLEDWFLALEDGTVVYRLPDPTFVAPSRPQLTPELVDEFVKSLDAGLALDAYGYQGQKFGTTVSCEFSRLATPQRLALAQALQQLLLSEQEMEEKVAELINQRPSEESE